MSKEKRLELLKERLHRISHYNPQLIKYTLFTISAIYTVLLFRSQGATEFSKFLQSVLGTMLELAKYTLPVIAIVGVIAGRKIPVPLRAVALILAVPCFYYSIMASKGFQLIELQAIDNKAVTQSPEYKNLNEQLTLKKNQLEIAIKNSDKLIKMDENNENKKNQLENTLNNDINKLQKQLNYKNDDLQYAINKSWYNTQIRLKKEIKQIEQSIAMKNHKLEGLTTKSATSENNKVIDNINKEISGISNKITNVKDGINQKSGYDILFKNKEAFAEFINWLAVLIEFIGIYFAIIVGLERNKKNKPVEINTTTTTPKIITANLKKNTVTARNDDTKNNQTLEIGKSEFYPGENDDSSPFQTKNKIGFQKENVKIEKPVKQHDGTEKLNEIDLKNDIKKYLEYMYEHIQDGGYAKGKRDIKKATGLPYRTIDLIWERLEKLKIIEVEILNKIKKTKIIKNKPEAIKLINKYF